MNSGFSPLSTLKAHLLAEAQRQFTDYDAALTAIGTGVAAAFEKFCNRKFQRTEDDTVTFTAAREVFILPRYPVEEVSAIALQVQYSDGFVAQSISQILNVHLASGVVRFGGTLGSDLDLVQLTYTGGYWWSTTEEADGTEALPDGATALPADLFEAWLLQCKKVWQVNDPLQTGIATGGANVQLVGLSLAGLELLPLVKQMITPHIRYQLT